MEFTKGNWNIDYSNRTHFIFDNNKVLIAEIDERITYKFNTPTSRACNANAQLIAAAPELLELCQLVYNSFGGGNVITFNEKNIQDFERVINKSLGITNQQNELNEPDGFNEWINKINDHVKKTKL